MSPGSGDSPAPLFVCVLSAVYQALQVPIPFHVPECGRGEGGSERWLGKESREVLHLGLGTPLGSTTSSTAQALSVQLLPGGWEDQARAGSVPWYSTGPALQRQAAPGGEGRPSPPGALVPSANTRSDSDFQTGSGD